MKTIIDKDAKGLNFMEKNKVSVWASQYPYDKIPEEYFEENFTHKKKRATNTWSNNFKLAYFSPDYLETNGVYSGTSNIRKVAGACSFSKSYIESLEQMAINNNMAQVTWIVLLHDLAYDPEVSGIKKDKFLTFLGAFDYDETADSLYEP
jgi:hypothetical protein